MSSMTVRFWGTRGSIPTPGRTTEKYGGNTTCVELRSGDEKIIFDAGSGIRELGNAWLNEFARQPIRASILFTHQHWDHIQGFPFFSCAYIPENAFTVYGEQRQGGGIEQLLSGQMSGEYFPIELSSMQKQLRFQTVTLEESFQIGDMSVKPFRLPHPGGSIGYRVQAGASVFVFATDCELDAFALNREQLKADHETPREYAPEFLANFENAHLIVIDAQYTDTVYKQRMGWGHNSTATLVDLCEKVSPHMLALTHHDPQSSDEIVTMMSDETSLRVKDAHREVLVFAAREGLTLTVAKPKLPLAHFGS